MALDLRGTARSGVDLASASFAHVKDLIISKEAPGHVGGYDALAYNTGNGNAAGVSAAKPLTAMTMGEVYDFQVGPMRARTKGRRGPDDVGSTGAGAYQFESATLAENAKHVFGSGWRNVAFTPDNQDKVAEGLWNRVRGNPTLRANTWAAFNEPGQPQHFAGKFNNREPLPVADPLAGVDTMDFVTGGIGLGAQDARRPLGPDHTVKPSSLDQRAAEAAALGGIPMSSNVDQRQAGNPEVQGRYQAAVADETAAQSHTWADRLGAAFEENSMAAALYRAFDAEHHEADPNWTRRYMDTIDQREAGMSADEQDEARESTSEADFAGIKQRIEQKRENAKVIASGGNGLVSRSTSAMLYGLAGGIADPVGLLLGAGVGEGFAAAGLGSRALLAAGRPLAAAASMAGEGAVGGLATAGGLDALGEHVTASDYATFAGFGAAANLAFGALPLALRKGSRGPVEEFANSAREQGAAARADLQTRAVANVGADPVKVPAEMQRLDAADKMDAMHVALADVPENHMLFPRDAEGTMLTGHDVTPAQPAKDGAAAVPERSTPNAFTQDIIDRHGLDAMPDEGMRAMAAEHVARAERTLRDNPINKDALKTILHIGNMESTANTLLGSDNPLAQAFAVSVLENPTAAAGRRSTGAITQHMRESVYMRQLAGFDDMYTMFRKGEGIGQMEEVWTTKARKQFNRRVFAEVEARSFGHSAETNPAILKAVDMLEKGYDGMRRDQQHVGTVGAMRLGESSTGYQPHRIMASKAAALMLNKGQRRAVAKVISRQLQDERNAYEAHTPEGKVEMRNWDEKFADQFAAKYLDDAARRAQGGYDIPLNLHDPEAADVVFDTAKALNISPEQADSLLGKFSRGGAGHTKGRLKLDLRETIPDGKGGEMPLMDLFNQDVGQLYRGYSRRVSGEVALAQYGIMGKKGLAVYRDAMRVMSPDNPRMLRAFDQVAAEFLNTPFGEHNHKLFDNLSILTSLSRLGGMGFTQVGEYANGIAAIGVTETLKSIGSFRRLAKEVGQLRHGDNTTNAILKDFDDWTGGVGVGEYHMTRLFDQPDNDIQLYSGENIGLGTRALRAGSNLQSMLSGHRVITAVQTRGMAEKIVHRAFKFVKAGTDDAALNDIGIHAGLRARLKENLEHIATFDAKGNLTGLNLQAGNLSAMEIKELTQSILRGGSQIIQHTFKGETGRWAHDGFLKLLTKFRTFSITSVEKQWGRQKLAFGTVKAFFTIMGAMSFALPIHMARVHARTIGMTRGERDKYISQHMGVLNLTRALMGYTSASGLMGDAYDMGSGVIGGWGGDDFSANVGVRGQGQGSITGLIPALGLADDMYKAANGNTHKLSKVLPFGNLPYIQPMFNFGGASN